MEMPPYNRRKFIKTSSLAGLSLLLGCRMDDPSTGNSNEEPSFNEADYDNFSKTIVIGSGFGESVSALRLGESGIQTTVLERGKWWEIKEDGNTFSPLGIPDQRSSWLTTNSIAPIGIETSYEKYVGVLERLDYNGMAVYGGSCVGGGSVVYGGITVEPDESLFQQVFPSEIDFNALKSTYFPRVRKMLDAQPIPSDDFSNNISPTVLDMANLPTGFDCQCLIHLGLTLDSNRGHFTYNNVTDDIVLNWNSDDIPKAALTDTLTRLNEVNGGELGNFILPDH